jgi:hypothetical protein
MGMRGAFCERLLKEFFREVIPRDFSILSGIVCDCHGGSSPQLDMIVVDDSQLPPLALYEDSAFVPVEAALMVAEIKMRFTSAALDQVSRQAAALASLRPSHRAEEGGIALAGGGTPVYSFVLALASDVPEVRLLEWLSHPDNRNVVAVCVVGECAYVRNSAGTPCCDRASEAAGRYGETLNFVGTLYHALRTAAASKALRPNWQQYMASSLKPEPG